MRRPLTKEEWRMGYSEDMRPSGCAPVAVVAFVLFLAAVFALASL